MPKQQQMCVQLTLSSSKCGLCTKLFGATSATMEENTAYDCTCLNPNTTAANPSMQKKRSMIRSDTTHWWTKMLNLDLTCFDNHNVKCVFGAFFVGNTDACAAMTNKERSKQCGLGVGVGWITVNDQEKLETRLELCCVLEMI